MKKIYLSIFTLLFSIYTIIGITRAYFTDSVSSNSNTMDMGTLDLTLDGTNTNVVKFNLTNIKPGWQKFYKWTIRNTGSVDGYIDIHNIVVTGNENNCLDSEAEAGDSSCNDPNAGDLGESLGLDLFIDYDCDTSFDVGDRKFYGTNKASNISANYDLNETLSAGTSKCLTAQFNWWSNRYQNDNLSQGDIMSMDLTMELGQTISQ